MQSTGIKTLDHSPNVAGQWLNELRKMADLANNRQAYRLMRATLHVLRDWLTVDEAAQLAAQLPILIRGVYYEGWNPSSTPVHPRGKEVFVGRIESEISPERLPNVEAAVSAVFGLLKEHISGGEIDDVFQAMPKQIRHLWP